MWGGCQKMNFTIIELIFLCSLGVMVMAWVAFVYFQLKKEIRNQFRKNELLQEN